jgi:hypothetical protein
MQPDNVETSRHTHSAGATRHSSSKNSNLDRVTSAYARRSVKSQIYKDHHLLIWDAVHNEETGSWTPSIVISWIVDDRYQFHKFEGPCQRSRAAALRVGKQLAEDWVDQQNTPS